jgi:class 3 adenylate cyclase
MFFAMVFVVGAPPTDHLGATLFLLLTLFELPLGLLLGRANSPVLMQLYLDDMILFTALSVLGGYSSHKLRERLATVEVLNRSNIEKFLGNVVTTAIFDGKRELLQERKATGFLLCMDIRGYTQLMQHVDEAVSSAFMADYHQLVNHVMGKNGGFVHRSMGDGYLISFGIMDPSAQQTDLSFLPGTEAEETAALLRRNQDFLKQCIRSSEEIFDGFYHLKEKFLLTEDLKLGVAIDYGNVQIKIHGDSRSRIELDLAGLTVIRCARLENYTRALSVAIGPQLSYMVVSPEASQFIIQRSDFVLHPTDTAKVRDFASIGWVLYRAFGAEEEVSTTRAA